MKLTKIIVSPGHDYWVGKGELTLQHGTQSPNEVVCEAGKGLVGDRYYHGRSNRKGQVTFIDEAVINAIRQRFDLAELDDSLFRRNLIVSGADLSTFLGKRFELQGVEFEGSQECRPCDWMDRMIAPGVKEFLQENFRGGLRAKVITSGRLVANS
ncbi:MOSC domain-containing protein [Rubripirellula amarantea]|uniref:MOSC domain protein n=1 Tax=Rubripirellula amarantea TaxID=2527999 RepID=A0A5C5WBQ5_9BACT|nr:MOSC domain-containing protein [Rubripirellula amarantea]MDA8743324.1 MOSC domain-containing protein [Rubripirellula amarantea]TWT47927.1 MOSC domain protein [Rubripirellula amarantea]